MGSSELPLDITSLKQALDTLRSLARQLLNVQEKERGHIARELHDEIGQELTGLKFFLETASRSSDGDGHGALEQGQHLLSRLMGKVHDMSLSLRPSMLDDMGLPSALRSLIRRFSSQSGIQVRFEHSGPDDRMDPEVETAAYRVVQEALTNASRHADTDDALVHVRVGDGSLEILIADEGAGFDPNTALTKSSSFGLNGMRERVELLGGTLSVESAPGEGTTLKAELPLGKPVEVS